MNHQKNRMKSAERKQTSAQSMQQSASQAMGRTGELVREYPASSALATFAVGCGVGLLAAWMLAPPRRSRSWYDDVSWPDWASRSGVTRAVESCLPQAVSNYFSRS